MFFFIVGVYFIYYLKNFLLSLKEKKEKNADIYLATLLYEWMLIDYVEEKYLIKTSKLFVVNTDFRWLTIDSTMFLFDIIFLYPFFFIKALFLVLVLLVMFFGIIFKLINDFIYFTNKTKKVNFLKFKLILLKLYVYLCLYFYCVHVFFDFVEDVNVVQELLIKFIFLYSFIYYYY